MKYRLYIDEVGNSDMGASADPNHRYLSLTGLVLELGYVDRVVYPELEAVKRRFFGSHPDEPVVLHRKELIQRRRPFEALKNPELERQFGATLIELLQRFDLTAFTAVIDKLDHQQKYTVWRYDPYHYCLHVIVERYVMWLRRRRASGDVMAESRGKKEDMRLKNSFLRTWEAGTSHMAPAPIQEVLTSRELKVKPKANNIAGLQLADVVAYPAWKAALSAMGGNPLPENLTGRIGTLLLDKKFDRSPAGDVRGWGIKCLP